MSPASEREILLVYRGGAAGIIATVGNEAVQLAREGFRVTLVLLGDPDSSKPHQGLEGVRVVRPRLWSRRLPKTGWAWVVKYVEFLWRIFWRTLFSPAPLVVAHDIDSLPAAWPAARLSGKRLVYFAIELYAERPEIPMPGLWRGLDRFFAKHVDATVSPQEDRTQFMIDRYGLREPILTVRNVPFFDPSARNHRSEMLTWLREKGIEARKVALYQGMLTPRRCVYELAEAAAYLDPDIVIVLIGAMNEDVREEFERLVDRFETRERILLYGYVLPDELGPLTASCHLGLVLQKDLGANTVFAAPIKMYQYLAAGLPVVGSHFPSITRVIEDPERPVGIGADPEDPKSIAAAIDSILSDEERLRAFRQNALWLAENRYRYDLESKPLVRLYRTLLEKASGKPRRT
jgi:glycosyltransferase involved in cell wall biosynthesis